MVSRDFGLLDFKIQNQRVPNFFVHFSILGSPLDSSSVATFATTFPA